MQPSIIIGILFFASIATYALAYVLGRIIIRTVPDERLDWLLLVLRDASCMLAIALLGIKGLVLFVPIALFWKKRERTYPFVALVALALSSYVAVTNPFNEAIMATTYIFVVSMSVLFVVCFYVQGILSVDFSKKAKTRS